MITDIAPATVKLRALRIIAALHATAAVAQPMLAGLYLSGVVDARFVHGRNGDAVVVFGLVQLIAAIVAVRKGARWWVLWAALAIFLAENAQMPLGIEGVVALHVPLGVSIVVSQVLYTVWIFRTAAERSRR